MAVTILLSSSVTSPLYSLSKGICADKDGSFTITVFCFITEYTGLATLILYDNDNKKTYSGYTNEIGAIGFRITGTLPEGSSEKRYPLMILIPSQEKRSFLTVIAD